MNTNRIQFRICHEVLRLYVTCLDAILLLLLKMLLVFFILEIVRGVPGDWDRSHCDVVQLVDSLFIQRLARECRREAEIPLSHNIEEVLIEIVQHKVGVSPVCFSAVEEKQGFQKFELSNGVIGRSSSLLTFFTENTDANMRSQDHGNIIGTIANCQSGLLRMLEPDHSDDVSLLLWRDPAGKNYINQI